MNTPETHTLQTLPANSAWARELCEQGMRKHYIKAFVELDVTAGRRAIRACKAVHACRYKRKQTPVFDDVDIGMPMRTRDKPEVHDYPAMTINLDHDVIDGAQAARFVSQLSRMLSNAHGCPT